MLRTVFVKKDHVKNINKEGRYITLVQGAGTVTVRVRFENKPVEETEIRAGMSIEFDEPFKEIEIYTSESSQLKIWAAMNPLTFNSQQIVTVGSEDVRSTGVQIGYGQPYPILPAENGRGRVMLQAIKPFFIMSQGASMAHAIKLPANEVFEINTQAAMQAFSDDPLDSAKFYSDFRGAAGSNERVITSEIKSAIYNPLRNELVAVNSAGTLTVASASDENVSFDSSVISSPTVPPGGVQYRDGGIDVVGFSVGGNITYSRYDANSYSLLEHNTLLPENIGIRQCTIYGKSAVFVSDSITDRRAFYVADLTNPTAQEITTRLGNPYRAIITGQNIVLMESLTELSVYDVSDVSAATQVTMPKAIKERTLRTDPVSGRITAVFTDSSAGYSSYDGGLTFIQDVSLGGSTSNLFFIGDTQYHDDYSKLVMIRDGQRTEFDIDHNISELVVADETGQAFFFSDGSSKVTTVAGEAGVEGGLLIKVLREVS
tara:strand:- start:3427 stop:4887 length:1461 start_codon:yes stop_codon:yes gene_type:complete